MRSKDLAKASGLAVAFDHTAPTFYRVSQNNGAPPGQQCKRISPAGSMPAGRFF